MSKLSVHRKLEILVVRVAKDGSLRNSRPCNHCLETMKLFGIKNVYYSNDDGTIGKERVIDLEPLHNSGGQKRYYRILNGLDTNIRLDREYSVDLGVG